MFFKPRIIGLGKSLRSRLALAALLAGVSQELTRAELVALLADPVTRDQALAATPEGQLTRELTNSIYPQWEILREMLEEALAAPQVIVPMHDAEATGEEGAK